jgi:para-aminobenzoate synthetase component 1
MHLEPLPTALTPVDAFRRLAHRPHVVFFDSAATHPSLGRYSFVAADPFDWIDIPADGTDALSALGDRLSRYTAETIPGLPPFQGGAAGLLGYELAHGLERLPRAAIDEFRVPALAVGLYDVVVAFDHVENKSWLISQGFPELDPAARRERSEMRLREFRTALLDDRPASPVDVSANGRPTLPADRLAPQFTVSASGQLTSDFDARSYHVAVERVVDYIHAGDVFQVNLSQRLLHPATESSSKLYLRLRDCNPAPFAGYFDLGAFQIVSASPERYLAVRDGCVETRPIKGTRSRGRSPEADLFAGDDLRASDKDRAENVMIVDLLRNDLSRVCRPESVRVSQLCGLETFAYVQHLVSAVEGRLDEAHSTLDLLRAAFPGGSITGAPKIRAMEIIAELEPTARGAYCGSLGYLGFDGTLDSSILIRTITAGRGWWQLPVGGGIVAQSDPRAEYEETWHKAEGMLRALQP